MKWPRRYIPIFLTIKPWEHAFLPFVDPTLVHFWTTTLRHIILLNRLLGPIKNGGIATQSYLNGTIYGTANVETTSALLLAYDQELRTLQSRTSQGFPLDPMVFQLSL